MSQPERITLIALDVFELAEVGPNSQKFNPEGFKLLFDTIYDHFSGMSA